jgi:tetratricopeptide (TPR) repeat protein
MTGKPFHRVFPSLLLTLTLTCAPLDAFPAPGSRAEALADLENSVTERRAEAVVWVANHGSMTDQPLLLKRLREDASPFVREFAEQGLWLLWSRSGEDDIDRRMAAGIELMQGGRLDEAIAAFGEVIRLRPAFAEGWNKRATVHYLAGRYSESIKDCDEVLKRNPSHFGALSGYGQIYFKLEKYDEALKWWRRALEVNPNMLGVEINIKTVERLIEERRRKAI